MRKKLLIKLLIAVFLGNLLMVLPAMAVNEGGQSGGGGQSGCGGYGWTLDTCYGAQWRYYTWPAGAESVYIKGKNASYAAPTTITGCKNEGGYWRYAMVAYGTGYYSDGTQYHSGDQVGVIGISGNYDATFNSVFMDGYMNYVGTSNDFNYVKGLYEYYQKIYPNILKKGWKNGSDIAWFCAKDKIPDDTPPPSPFYSSSHISNRSTPTARANVNDWDSTGITNTFTEKSISSSDVCLNDTLDITFSHNAYANESKQNVSWKVERKATINGSERNGFTGTGYSISMPAASVNSWNSVNATQTGTMNITESRSGTPKFIAQGTGAGTSRTKSDGDNWYVSRDFYEIRFSTAGTYKFCETFYADGTAITKACSSITVKNCDTPPPPSDECGAWTPSSFTSSNETSGTSSVVSKVKNTTLSTGWEDTVYAKPTDTTDWIHCYYPGAQTVAYSDATDLHGEHDHDLSSGGTTANTYDYVSNLYSSWGNYLKVYSSGFNNFNPSKTTTYDIGDYNTKKITDQYKISSTEKKAGKTLYEKGESSRPSRAYVTNNGKHSWGCDWGESCSSCGTGCNATDPETGECTDEYCKECYRSTCHHSNDYVSYSAYNYAYDYAYVKVPYNFINTAEIQLETDTVFAGETAKVSSLTAHVHPKYNGTTNGTYATNVDNAKVKIIAYTSTSNAGSALETGGDICSALAASTGYTECNEVASKNYVNLNTSGYSTSVVTEGTSKLKPDNLIYNVYDVPAGRYYCVVLALYPANSGADTNMSTTGSDSWYVSAPSCATVAKKPSLQVWGSGLFTAGKIAVSNAVKRVVSGKIAYTAKDVKNVVFGSWVEQNVVANGLVNLASGAADGKAGSTVRTYSGLDGNYSDTSANAICILSPLTMPNSKCSTSTNPGGSRNSMSAPVEKAALIERFTNADGDGDFELHSGVCTLSGAPSFATKMTQVYKCDDTFTINGNVEALTGSYSSLIDIPKIIIYAKNINITCNVTRIDAVLIADNNVDTCSDGGNVNSQARSKQLRINGTVITNKLLAKRTYGAATGTNSSEPAEIIDYDTSLYLWGSPRADTSASGKLESVYQAELAPRY